MSDRFQCSITKVRARLKLFDDTDGGAAGLFSFMARVREQSEVLFAHPTNRWLQLLSRTFRPDLGVFFVDGRLVATTHASLPAMGFTPELLLGLRPGHFEDIGSFLHDFSRSIGEYFVNLSEVLQAQGLQLTLKPEPARIDFSVTHNDFVGRRFYRYVERSFPAVRRDQVPALTICLGQVNTALYVLPALLGERSNLVLRVQFLAAYHGTNALRAIFGALPRELDHGSSTVVALRPLRNLLAHYGLRQASRFALGTEVPFERAIEGVAEMPFESVVSAVREQLNRISEFLGGVMSKSSLKPVRAVLGDHT